MRQYKRIVIKVGTKVITSKERTLDIERIKDIVVQISEIINKGVEVVLVTSGAIGAGLSLLSMRRRPQDLSRLQATAAIGQNYLMHLYSSFFKECFKREGLLVGQVLLTQEDFNDRKRYLNIKHTIETLLKYKAMPIINENDTVATDEIRCGDNDRLSSLVADLCGADLLVILTDVDGLLDEDGRPISIVDEITPKVLRLAGRSECDLGTGGMATKLEAARNVTRAGIDCIVANGKEERILFRIIDGALVGTTFKSAKGKFIAKKRWIAFSSKPKGTIRIDDGAKDAILVKRKSLLGSGISGLSGNFLRGDVVRIVDLSGKEVAKGISNYSSDDISKIKGLKSSKFNAVLGYKGHDEVVHRDNLVVL